MQYLPHMFKTLSNGYNDKQSVSSHKEMERKGMYCMNSRIRSKLRRKGARFTALLLALTLALGSVTAAFAEGNGEEDDVEVANETEAEEAAADVAEEAEAEEAAAELQDEEVIAEMDEEAVTSEEAEAVDASEESDSDAEELEEETIEAVSSAAGDIESYIVVLGVEAALSSVSSEEDSDSGSDSELEELIAELEELVATVTSRAYSYSTVNLPEYYDALAAAETVLSSDEATEEEIMEVITALQEVLDLLPEPEEIVASGTCGDALTWTLSGGGVLTISGTGEMYDFIFSPWTGYFGLAGATYLIRSIVIEEGVTSIGEYAFRYGSTIDNVEIASSVVPIGKGAFLDCTNLSDVTGCEGVTMIGARAFSGCSLSSIYISDKVNYIGALAFASYDDAVTIYFAGDAPELGREYASYSDVNDVYVTNILANAVSATVSFDSSYDGWTEAYLADLNDGAECSFYDRATETWVSVTVSSEAAATSGICGDNLTWTLSEDGVLTITGTGEMYGYSDEVVPWYRYRDEIESIVIEEGVTSIGDYAFCSLKCVYDVEIASSVVSVGASAFMDCTGLEEVTGGEGVTTIAESAFDGCNTLVDFPFSEVLVSVGDYAFYYCRLSYIYLPVTVTYIGTYAFKMPCADSTVYFAGDAPELGTEPIGFKYFDSVVVSYDSTYDGWTEEYLEALMEGADGYCYDRAADTLVSYSESSSDSDSENSGLEELTAKLQAVVSGAIYLNGSYTSESLAVLQAALASAEAVLSSDDTTEDGISEAIAALQAAMSSLVEDETALNDDSSSDSGSDSDSDKEELTAELEELVASAIALEGSYTSESLAVLQAALASAEAVLLNEDATEEEISAVMKKRF